MPPTWDTYTLRAELYRWLLNFRMSRIEEVRRGLRTVLQTRGLTPPDDLHARIANCTDASRLLTWVARASTTDANLERIFAEDRVITTTLQTLAECYLAEFGVSNGRQLSKACERRQFTEGQIRSLVTLVDLMMWITECSEADHVVSVEARVGTATAVDNLQEP